MKLERKRAKTGPRICQARPRVIRLASQLHYTRLAMLDPLICYCRPGLYPGG